MGKPLTDPFGPAKALVKTDGGHPSSATVKALSHVPALDGVRGLAILLVVFGHLTAPFHSEAFRQQTGMWSPVWWFYQFTAFGWTGVDLFFVLSGFLITGILLDTKRSPEVVAKQSRGYFKNFYMRRVLRICPLYFGALLIVLVIVPLFHNPISSSGVSATTDQIYWWMFAANFAIAAKPVLAYQSRAVFWSLAVEEHFYLLWPAVVRFTSLFGALLVCAALIVLSPGLREIAILHHMSFWAIYMLTPLRMDSLATGALIAILLRLPSARPRAGEIAKGASENAAMRPAKLVLPAWLVAAVTLPALMLIAFNWHWHLDSANMGLPLALIFSFLALFFGSLIVLAIGIPHEQGVSKWLPRFFRSGVMRFFGKYSYGIYVIHLFVAKHVIWFFNHKHLGSLINYFVIQLLSPLTCLGISTGLAVLSWHFYEKRFLDLKRYFPSIVGAPSK